MRILLFAWTVAFAVAASAQDDAACRKIEAARPKLLERMPTLVLAECLAGQRDAAPVTRKVLQLLAPAEVKGEEAGELAHVADRALAEVAAHVAGALQADFNPVLAALAGEIEVTRKALAQRVPLAQRDRKGWEWDGGLKKFGGLPVDFSSVDLDCAAPSEACTRTTAATAEVFRAAKLVERSLAFVARKDLNEALAAARVRDAKWTNYFDTARLQYPHELLFNGWLHGRANKAAGGFAEVPTSQWILAHPGIGMEYVRGAPAGSRFEAALVVEWLGYNRWSWTREGGMANALGVSFIQTYSDRAGLSSARPGVMFHWQNKYSAAITRNSDKTGFVVSVDLAKWLTKVEDDARSKFRLSGTGRQ